MALPTSPATASGEKAALVLETLAVKGRAPKTGYARDLFGQSWADVNRNGCDTRNDILKRDLTDIVYKTGTRNCVVASGTLVDRYSGETINFVRGNITSMEIEKLADLTALTFQADFKDFDYQKIKIQTRELALTHNLDIYFDTLS